MNALVGRIVKELGASVSPPCAISLCRMLKRPADSSDGVERACPIGMGAGTGLVRRAALDDIGWLDCDERAWWDLVVPAVDASMWPFGSWLSSFAGWPSVRAGA